MVIYRKIANIYTVCLVVLFLLNYYLFFDAEFRLLGLLTFIGILLYLPSTTDLSRWFSIAMLIIGGIILWVAQIPVTEWAPMFTKNMPLVILILFVPVLAIPLSIGQYNEEVKKIIEKYSEQPKVLFAGITSTVFILGSIINLGALAIVHSVVDRNSFPKRFLGVAYVRGFTSVIIWSPFFASVFLILFALDLSIGNFLLYSLTLGVIQLLVANVWFNYVEKSRILFERKEYEGNEINNKKIAKLTVIFLLLITIILVAERFIQENMSIFITIIVVVFTIIWSLFINKIVLFTREFSQYIHNIIPGRANEVALFLTAGFFSGALVHTTLGHYLQRFLVYLGNYSIILVIFFIIFLTVFLALLGIHQIVTITAFLASVTPVDIGISNLIFALTLTSSWSLSTLLSPITPVNIISGGLLHTKITQLMKWNVPFAIVMMFIYTIIIYVYHLIL